MEWRNLCNHMHSWKPTRSKYCRYLGIYAQAWDQRIRTKGLRHLRSPIKNKRSIIKRSWYQNNLSPLQHYLFFHFSNHQCNCTCWTNVKNWQLENINTTKPSSCSYCFNPCKSSKLERLCHKLKKMHFINEKWPFFKSKQRYCTLRYQRRHPWQSSLKGILLYSLSSYAWYYLMNNKF